MLRSISNINEQERNSGAFLIHGIYQLERNPFQLHPVQTQREIGYIFQTRVGADHRVSPRRQAVTSRLESISAPTKTWGTRVVMKPLVLDDQTHHALRPAIVM